MKSTIVLSKFGQTKTHDLFQFHVMTDLSIDLMNPFIGIKEEFTEEEMQDFIDKNSKRLNFTINHPDMDKYEEKFPPFYFEVKQSKHNEEEYHKDIIDVITPMFIEATNEGFIGREHEIIVMDGYGAVSIDSNKHGLGVNLN